MDFGESHAIILKNDGSLYSWGMEAAELKHISNLKDVKIGQISCGAGHSAAIASESGDLFTWGSGYQG